MFSIFTKFILNFTSIGFFYLSFYFFPFLKENFNVASFYGETSDYLPLPLIPFFISLFCFSVFYYLNIYAHENFSITKIKVRTLKPTNSGIFTCFILLLLPFLLNDFLFKTVVLIAIPLVFAFYCLITAEFNINPLFYLFYNCYICEDSCGRKVFILQKKDQDSIRNPSEIENLNVIELTTYIYLIKN